MARTYYPQHPMERSAAGPTLTVGQLIEQLQKQDPTKPVIFRSPLYGSFGSNTAYSIDTVEAVSLEGRTEEVPGGTSYDEETGDEFTYEGWTDVWHPWEGVVLG